MSRYPPPRVELTTDREPRQPKPVPAPGESQQGRCPICRRAMYAVQLLTGPGWLCGCVAKPSTEPSPSR